MSSINRRVCCASMSQAPSPAFQHVPPRPRLESGQQGGLFAKILSSFSHFSQLFNSWKVNCGSSFMWLFFFNVPEGFVSARRPHLQPCCKYLQKPLNHHLTLLCRLCGNTASLQSASAEASPQCGGAISVTLLQGCLFNPSRQSAFPRKNRLL